MTEDDSLHAAEALRLVLELANGNFEARGALSDRYDSIDAIVAGLNMLADELQTERTHRARAEVNLAEHARLVERLQRSESELLEIQRLAGMGSWEWDVAGGTMRWSESLAEIFGVPATWTDKRAWEAFTSLLHSDDRRRALAVLTEAMRTREPFELRYRIVRPDGGDRHIHAKGVFTGDLCRGFASDVTARIVAEQERARMEERLRLSDRMASVGTLAAGVAHEINNPLSYVIANVRYALEQTEAVSHGEVRLDELSPRLFEPLSEAAEGAERVRNIVRDLKTFSRPDESSATDVDVHAVLESTINMVWNEIRHRARLIKDFSPVPPVRGNTARLGQVFMNLLVNAAQAIPDGASDRHSIRIVTRLEEPSRSVCIEVHDDGTGIAEEHLPRIFEPFYTTKDVGVGTGLGLSICHGIVQSLGGSISVDSTVGHGSIFSVRLPAIAPEARAPQPARAASRSIPSGRVLAIDDDPSVLRALGRGLRPQHHFVGHLTAADALETIGRGERFDIIFCDLMMPSMNGIEFFAQLTTHHTEQAERVVFLTGGAFSQTANNFLSDKLTLDKPFNTDEIRSLVRQYIARGSPEQQRA
jgi:signal transduction histidine kinase/CheY-like chemotaxis protein